MTSALKNIQLLVPSFDDGLSVMNALGHRHTSREFAPQPLSLRDISGILWSAYGINRPDGRRTTPSAIGVYPLRIYVFTSEGVYLYRPDRNLLEEKVAGDYRMMAGTQDFVETAPMSLLIFSDYAEFDSAGPRMAALIKGHEERASALDAGASAENMYLYCSENNINTVERMMVDEQGVKKFLGLPDSCHFMTAMSMGYPR